MARKWCIRVMYASGDEAYLRRGSRVGFGPVVQFQTRKDAEVNLDFISQGLERGDVAVVVPYSKEAGQEHS